MSVPRVDQKKIRLSSRSTTKVSEWRRKPELYTFVKDKQRKKCLGRQQVGKVDEKVFAKLRGRRDGARVSNRDLYESQFYDECVHEADDILSVTRSQSGKSEPFVTRSQSGNCDGAGRTSGRNPPAHLSRVPPSLSTADSTDTFMLARSTFNPDWGQLRRPVLRREVPADYFGQFSSLGAGDLEESWVEDQDDGWFHLHGARITDELMSGVVDWSQFDEEPDLSSGPVGSQIPPLTHEVSSSLSGSHGEWTQEDDVAEFSCPTGSTGRDVYVPDEAVPVIACCGVAQCAHLKHSHLGSLSPAAVAYLARVKKRERAAERDKPPGKAEESSKPEKKKKSRGVPITYSVCTIRHCVSNHLHPVMCREAGTITVVFTSYAPAHLVSALLPDRVDGDLCEEDDGERADPAVSKFKAYDPAGTGAGEGLGGGSGYNTDLSDASASSDITLVPDNYDAELAGLELRLADLMKPPPHYPAINVCPKYDFPQGGVNPTPGAESVVSRLTLEADPKTEESSDEYFSQEFYDWMSMFLLAFILVWGLVMYTLYDPRQMRGFWWLMKGLHEHFILEGFVLLCVAWFLGIGDWIFVPRSTVEIHEAVECELLAPGSSLAFLRYWVSARVMMDAFIVILLICWQLVIYTCVCTIIREKAVWWNYFDSTETGLFLRFLFIAGWLATNVLWIFSWVSQVHLDAKMNPISPNKSLYAIPIPAAASRRIFSHDLVSRKVILGRRNTITSLQLMGVELEHGWWALWYGAATNAYLRLATSQGLRDEVVAELSPLIVKMIMKRCRVNNVSKKSISAILPGIINDTQTALIALRGAAIAFNQRGTVGESLARTSDFEKTKAKYAEWGLKPCDITVGGLADEVTPGSGAGFTIVSYDWLIGELSDKLNLYTSSLGTMYSLSCTEVERTSAIAMRSN